MCDYPFFIPQVVLFANSSLFWFKVTNEHREFRNYLFLCFIVIRNCSVPSQLRVKMHSKSPSVMAFCLICLGILAKKRAKTPAF